VKHLVQRPLPDESICSALMRTARRAGLPIGALTPALTGGRKWYPGFFQGGHLSTLADCLRVAPEELLWSHTYFPYATAFFHRAQQERCHANALAIGKTALGQSVVTQGVSEHCPFRRFCAACAKSDVLAWGESYWHRAHNLPGVRICLMHQLPLTETSLHTTGTGQWHDVVPAEAHGRSLSIPRLTPFDLELARMSLSLLAMRGDAADRLDRTHYRHALIRRGLLSSDRPVNAVSLSRWAIETIGRSTQSLVLKNSDLDFAWMAQMVRPNVGITATPFKHIIFQSAIVIARETEGPVLDHVPSGPSGGHIDGLDAQYSRRVTQVINESIRNGERIRVKDALTAAGCWSAYRHARTAFPKTGAAVLALRKSEASARRLAQ
jgi:TniQ